MRTILNLETTNKCNRRCVYCGDKKTRKVGFITLVKAKEYLDKFTDLSEIRLYISGEPLLHPQIIELIKLAKNYCTEVELSTNCDLLDTLGKELIASGLDRIILSVHDKTVLDKIKVFLSQNNHKIHTILKVIIPNPKTMPTNMEVLEEFDGLDEADVRRPHNWDVRDSVTGGEPGEVTPPERACWFPNSFISVLWDGRVVACCNDLNGRWTIGDLNKDDLLSIEARLDSICENMRNRESVSFLCDNCERYKPRI